MQSFSYRGRFAPTPSGPLHLGSLLTALASYLEARRNHGAWLLRIDDLDTPRVAAGAEGRILRQLENHGLLWDETPRRQSEHIAEYEQAWQALDKRGLLYACACTRLELASESLPGPDGPVYSGKCRSRGLTPVSNALRMRVPDQQLSLHDGLQGLQRRELARDVGDFVVRRRDGVVAYQLACAIDEHAQGITEVVRGADLLGSTFRQLQVMRMLHLREPRYRHLPVLVDGSRRKLSKQNHALALDETHASGNLVDCLAWLGQQPPPPLKRSSAGEVLAWALETWEPARIPRTAQIEMRSL